MLFRPPKAKAARRGTTALLSIVLLLAPVLAPGPVSAENPGLTGAISFFEDGSFEKALHAIDETIALGGLSISELRNAYALKARCEAELGNRTNAVNSFCQVIMNDPDWRPDPNFYTAGEMELFEQALDRCYRTPDGDRPRSGGVDEESGSRAWYKKPITWIAGGAAIALLAIVAGGGGGDGDDDDDSANLPDYPPPPQ